MAMALYLSSAAKGHGKSTKARKKLAPLDATNMEAEPSSSPSGNGSPSHINTVRSLGLLHELQDYINSVESLTNEQKQELLRLREEKKAMERMARHHGKANNGSVNLGGDIFRQSQLQELPPRLRAVLEDNKAMKEKLKSYKNRMLAAEHLASQKNSQIIIMENAIGTLKQQLAACSRTPAQVESEENLKSMLYSSGRAVKNLEYEVNVLKQKVDTDAKLHRQAMAASRREQSALERKIILLNATVAEKDIEIRKANLEVKQLTRRLAPKRGHPSNMVSTSLDELEAQEQMHMQRMMESSYQQGPYPAESPHLEQQDQQQHEQHEQQQEQAGDQQQQAHEEERGLAPVLSLGMGMPPGEQEHPDSQQTPEQQDEAGQQQQDEPQGPGDPHGEEQGAATAEGSAAPEVPLAAAAEPAIPQPSGGQEGGAANEGHEAQGPEEAPQDAAAPATLAAAETEPEEAAAAAAAAAAEASPSLQPEGEEHEEHKETDVPQVKEGARPEGAQHSAAPKAVPYRHTAARAAGRGPGQKKEPPTSVVPPKASNSSKAAKGGSMLAKEAGPDQASVAATPAVPAEPEPAGPGLEAQGVPATEPAAAEAKPTESESGVPAAESTAAEDTAPAASSSEAQGAPATDPEAAEAKPTEAESAGTAQLAAESGGASAGELSAQGGPPGGEGGDAVEPGKAGEAPVEPAAAEQAVPTESPVSAAGAPSAAGVPTATETPESAAGAPEAAQQSAEGVQAEAGGASTTEAPPAEQTGAPEAEPAAAGAAAAEPAPQSAAAEPAAATEPAAEPAAAAPSVEPAGASGAPAEQSATEGAEPNPN